MLRSQLLALTFLSCAIGVSVSASERAAPSVAPAPQPGPQADNARLPTPEPERQIDNQTDNLPSLPPLPVLAADPASPPVAPGGFGREFAERPERQTDNLPDSLASLLPLPALAADPAPQPAAPAGFAGEFAERLAAAEGRLSAADRADRAALAKFYEARQNEPVWVTPAGLSPAAETVVAEIGRAGDWGLDAAAFRLPARSPGAELTRDLRADAEIMLSLAILKYARHARGGRAEPLSLSRNLDRTLRLLDPQSVIEAAANAQGADAYLRSLHPQHPQFERLRQHYLALQRGEPAAQVEQVAQRDRKSSKKRAAKAPAGASQRTLLVNMEQWRWMPEDLGNFYVWVNIPEYTIRVVRAGGLIHSERVVVGRVNTQTPVFSDEMEQVIFHPYWGVPESIKKNELLPSLARGNTGVLERQNLRVSYRGRDINPVTVDWTKADMRNFHVYQPPGSGNALGIVKFRFPNKHDVYMHDTPSKSLFNASARAFSHGCMRVRDPLRLAELVLAEDRGWPAGRVMAAVRSGPKDNQINLVRKVPVHMTYFTAWVEDDGKLRIYGDIYGHENRIALGISGKAYLIQREKEMRPPPRARERVAPPPQMVSTTGSRSNSKGWMRGVFQN